jgi:four helix bundle protein
MASDPDRIHGPERLRVYHLALELAEVIDTVLRNARCTQSLADQARRTADSIVLNIAEGSALFSPGRKLYHYETALGSAGECIAALSRLRRRNPGLDLNRPRRMAELISAMLVALIRTQQKRRHAQ